MFEACRHEYLLAAAEDPDQEVLSRAKSDVVKARAANSVRKARKAMEPLPTPDHTIAIVSTILILTVVVQVLLVKSWT